MGFPSFCWDQNWWDQGVQMPFWFHGTSGISSTCFLLHQQNFFCEHVQNFVLTKAKSSLWLSYEGHNHGVVIFFAGVHLQCHFNLLAIKRLARCSVDSVLTLSWVDFLSTALAKTLSISGVWGCQGIAWCLAMVWSLLEGIPVYSVEHLVSKVITECSLPVLILLISWRESFFGNSCYHLFSFSWSLYFGFSFQLDLRCLDLLR